MYRNSSEKYKGDGQQKQKKKGAITKTVRSRSLSKGQVATKIDQHKM